MTPGAGQFPALKLSQTAHSSASKPFSQRLMLIPQMLSSACGSTLRAGRPSGRHVVALAELVLEPELDVRRGSPVRDDVVLQLREVAVT